MRWKLVAILPLIAFAGPGQGQDAKEGAAIYQHHCATCHGTEAKGDGPMAPVLLVPPADLTTLTERHGAFPVLRIVTRIDGRDPLISHGSDMPVWGWFFEGEGVALKLANGQPLLTTKPIVDVVVFLEGLQQAMEK